MSEKKFFTIKGDYAVASFIISIMSVVLFFPFFASDGLIALIAIILGSFSLRGTRRGFAIAGIIIGSLVVVYVIVFMIRAPITFRTLH